MKPLSRSLLGGEEYSKEHIKDTARLISTAPITYLSTLQLGLEDGAKERFLRAFDSFTSLNDLQILHEQRELISLINPPQKIIFRSNHASNALHLSGTLPKDRDRLLGEIDDALV
ncbi:MAG: hypothetical protein PHO27_12700 [Sulfuricurvum sp.]|nr:hypothetical protein [Sulfuricurvum sp.]